MQVEIEFIQYIKPNKCRLIEILEKIWEPGTDPKYVLFSNGTTVSYNPKKAKLPKGILNIRDAAYLWMEIVVGSKKYNKMIYYTDIDEFAIICHGIEEWCLIVLFDKLKNKNYKNSLDMCLISRKIIAADKREKQIIASNI